MTSSVVIKTQAVLPRFIRCVNWNIYFQAGNTWVWQERGYNSVLKENLQISQILSILTRDHILTLRIGID